MNKRKKESITFQKRKIICLDEDAKQYIYPSIPNSPIFFCDSKIIYGFGNLILLFCKKENKFIKKIEEHKSIIRSIDASANEKYFLTSGDDKHIIVYDKEWNVLYKILHKKKIAKAYFLKYQQKTKNKFEIIFVDKYGDVYIFDLNCLKNDNGPLQKKEKEKGNEPIQFHEIKLLYLYDTLDCVEEGEVHEVIHIKEFEEAFVEMKQTKMMIDDTRVGSINDVNNFNENMSDRKNSKEQVIEEKQNEMEETLNKLEEHYKKCFENDNLLYPIFTCNSSAATCLYYDNKYLIIGDKDEKIRLIKNQSIQKIYNFYLNHKQFITSITLINEHAFCSAAADSYLYLWNITNKDISDFLYIDFSLISKLIHSDLENNFKWKEQNFIVSMLQFNETVNSIFAIVENFKGVFVFPLMKNENKNTMQFDKERISFYSLNENVLSFIIIPWEANQYLFFVDRKNGFLHQIEIVAKYPINKDEEKLNTKYLIDHVDTFEHFYLKKTERIDIGLVNYWKHTTLEESIN